MPKFQRGPRRRTPTIDLPPYFKTAKWADLAANRPIVLIYIRDGEVQDVILRSVDPEAARNVPDTIPAIPDASKAVLEPNPGPRREIEAAPEPDDAPDGLPPDNDDPDEMPMDDTPAPAPAVPEEEEAMESIDIGSRVEGAYDSGEVFTGTIVTISADETEVVVKMDHTGRKEFIPSGNLTKVLVSD